MEEWFSVKVKRVERGPELFEPWRRTSAKRPIIQKHSHLSRTDMKQLISLGSEAGCWDTAVQSTCGGLALKRFVTVHNCARWNSFHYLYPLKPGVQCKIPFVDLQRRGKKNTKLISLAVETILKLMVCKCRKLLSFFLTYTHVLLFSAHW